MRKIIFILVLLCSRITLANFLSDEIRELNLKYRNTMPYPIIIFDKENIIKELTGDENIDVKFIKNKMLEDYQVDISMSEATDVLLYHTKLNKEAVSVRFEQSGFCAVFPAKIQNNRESEIKRLLGINEKYNPYPESIVQKAQTLVTLREIQLMSLYHELSHCLDSDYIPNLPHDNSHNIHMVESYAEVLGLMLLQQKYNFNKLFLRRAALRALYSKYYGKLLLTDPTIIVFEDYEKEMGIIYDVSSSLLKSQGIILRNKELEEIKYLAKTIVEGNNTSSRTMAAIRSYLQSNKEKTLSQYRNYVKMSPELFYQTYLELSHKIDFYERDLDLLLNSI